jgi:hypothetical protein
MNEALWGTLALDAVVLVTSALAVGYLSKVGMPRPPAGLFVGSDIVIMVALLVIMPFAYLNLPVAFAATMFGLTVFAGLQFTLAPIIGGRGALALAVLLCAFEITAYIVGWPTALMISNDAALVVMAVGVTNMWAQTGMKPHLVAGLAAALVVYDTLATVFTTMTADFIQLVDGIPFAPMLAARYGPSPVAMGLGDLLMLTLWPLVVLKAYGRIAAIAAAAINTTLLAAMFAAFATGALTLVPVLTPLGMLVVAQFLYWHHRNPNLIPRRPAVEDALNTSQQLPSSHRTHPSPTWIAIHNGTVVATANTPGLARRAARIAGITEIPAITLDAG